ncbi:MAG: nicotinate-nucleotide adenylyltransferase [Candidatus Margulisbacteria bacterium]|nr:nicotinate-nucleotide adenylyltransferase [Candidatus Margulisiibacteriota bacterium]
MRRIGIMGGTFNPIHKGHIALAKAAQKAFALSQVIFIPSGTPPHKALDEIIDKEERLKMVRLAIKGIKKFSVSRIEIDRPGYSYAVDTFRALRRKYGAKTKLFYIMGLDSINEILEWKKPLELFKLCEFIAGTRPGHRVAKIPQLNKVADRIHFIGLGEDISASEIRRKIVKGGKVGKLVPKAVADYIKKRGLYK